MCHRKVLIYERSDDGGFNTTSVTRNTRILCASADVAHFGRRFRDRKSLVSSGITGVTAALFPVVCSDGLVDLGNQHDNDLFSHT